MYLMNVASNYFRSSSALGRVKIGRRGESLSMKYERDRLVASGYNDAHPYWAAIHDETLG